LSTSTNLSFPYLAAGQAQKHVTVNETLLRLDAIVQLAVVSATVSAEPGSPSGKISAHVATNRMSAPPPRESSSHSTTWPSPSTPPCNASLLSKRACPRDARASGPYRGPKQDLDD
jgi:hypothetical protein